MTAIQDIATDVSVSPVAGHIGAEISGVDISRPLSPEQVTAIRGALERYKVIFFRGQNLDHASQIAFGRQFGELTYAHPHDDAPPESYPEIFTVHPDRFTQRYGEGFRQEYKRRQYSYFTGWHTDVTAAVNPPAGSILRADVVPEIGGDTQWTNLVAAYEDLSAPLQEFVGTLRAEHRYGGSAAPGSSDSAYARRINDNLQVAIHPVVRVHPAHRGEGAVRQPRLHQPHRGGVRAREHGHPGPPVLADHAA
jgi:taurine dioxygenase